MEEWKSIVCDSEQCMSEMFVPENMKASDNSLSEEALKKYKIYPDIDNDLLTQFSCRRCGKVVTWGVTRKNIARQLYERYTNV